MRILKTKWFHRWAAKEGLTEVVLRAAAMELERGLGDALGGYVYKKRIALPGRGKRGGARIIYFVVRLRERLYLLLAYAKNERVNLSPADKRALGAMARRLEELG